MKTISKSIVKDFLKYAKYSEAAYKNSVNGRKLFKKYGIEHLMFFSGKTTQLFVGNDKNDNIVISIRGTDPSEIEDILTDADITLRDFHFGKVHRGFYNALDEVYSSVVVLLKQFDVNHKIIINGHSLGGALSVLLATRLTIEHGFKNIEIITYGQPRVGDESFINEVELLFGNLYKRIVNDLDAVPKLPPVSKLCFAHSDDLYLIQENSNIIKTSAFAPYASSILALIKDFTEESKVDLKVTQKVLKENLKESFEDHRIDNYIEKIQKAYDLCTNSPEQSA